MFWCILKPTLTRFPQTMKAKQVKKKAPNYFYSKHRNVIYRIGDVMLSKLGFLRRFFPFIWKIKALSK